MKRMLVMILALLLLLACVPTPEQEFVVNKGDDTVEQKLNETSAGEAESGSPAQFFPEHWAEDPIVKKDQLIIRADAEIHTRTDGLYPVYRSQPSEITQETVENIAIKFLDKPTASSEALLTKEDLGRALQRFLDERARYDEWVKAGKPNDWNNVDEYEWTPEEIEEQTNRYMEQIKNAPDSLSEQAVNDYSGLEKGKPQSFTLAAGGVAWIYFNKSAYVIAKDCKSQPNIYPYDRYQDDLRWQEGNYKRWIETDLTREQAERLALSELERLGYTGFAVSEASKATLLDTGGASARGVAGGWSLVLKRDYGGYPQIAGYIYASRNLEYGSGDGFLTNQHIDPEQFRLFVSEDGIQYLDYSGAKEITGLVNANVQLLPFDEIKVRIKNALSACFPYEKWATDPAVDPRPVEVEIYRIYLTTFTVRAKDSSDYYEMPCWIAVYDMLSYVSNPNWTWDDFRSNRDDPGHGDFLIVNAVDGSIVHEDFGF